MSEPAQLVTKIHKYVDRWQRESPHGPAFWARRPDKGEQPSIKLHTKVPKNSSFVKTFQFSIRMKIEAVRI